MANAMVMIETAMPANWSVEEVQLWLEERGFGSFREKFAGDSFVVIN